MITAISGVVASGIASVIPPTNTVAPVISGTNVVGNTLTTTNGTWNGTAPTYTYQWKRGASNIVGATSSTYTLVQADATTSITCVVTATNSVGSANASSNALTIFDSNANNFIVAESGAGVTLTSTQQNAINQLVVDLKAASIWTKMIAIYPMVGGTSTSHKFNLVNPADTNAAYRLAFVGGWTHSANGALPNGTNAYAETYLAANGGGLTNATGHISYYSRTLSGTDMTHAMGYYITSLSTITAIIPRGSAYGNTQAGWMAQANNSQSTIVTANTQGFLGVTRTATNAHKTWKNTTFSPNGANFTSINGTRTFYIGAANHPVAIQYGNFECAFSSIGLGLTDAEVLLFRTAVQNFNTTLGRQV